MFENKFNTRKTDPLVEAVKQAQQDGELRRQAIAIVNEQFGVYNRNAVVREDLAGYDISVETVYQELKEGEKKDEKKEDKPKSDYSKMREKMVGKGKDLETTRKIVGEAKKLADKDYDKDGKVESPKDEVWGSRLRAAKMAGKLKEEEQIDEISQKLATRYTKKSFKDMKQAADFGDTMSIRNRAKGIGMASKKLTGGAKVPANEETDYSAQDRAPVTKSAPKEDPSTPKSYPGAASTVSGPNPTSQRMSNAVKPKLQEAKYSYKSARRGEDIGKPGKMFGKIAKSAGEQYGSEERGKKVAGAILAKIRAKHMKEDSSF